MQITSDIKDTIGALSKVNLDFLHFVEQEPDCLKRENFSELEELRNKLYFLQAWPTFLGEETKKKFCEAGVEIFKLIKSIPERLFQKDTHKMSDFYQLPVSLLDLQMEGVTQEHLDQLLARGDFIFSPHGLKCLEYNIASNLGGDLLPLWESLYLKNPLIQRFLKEYRVTIKNENLLEQYLAHCMRAAAPLADRFNDTEINIALVLKGDKQGNLGPMAGYLDKLYREVLQRQYPTRNGNIFFCDFPALDVQDDKIYYQGHRVHALTEWYFGVLPPRIMKAFKAGNIRIMNGPITNLLSAKSNLALLSEHVDINPGIFSTKENEIIKTYIPWTRKITTGKTTYRDETICLEDFILYHKDILVIKPSLGLGGEGIYIGKNTPQEQWEKQVKKALQEKNWVVQEAVASGSALYRHGENSSAVYDMVWGFLIFGSHYAGTFLRVILKKEGPRIVNAHQGAQVSVVFEVNKEE
ncbi:MAG: hypothetical protein MUF15_08855 [Acidobacteria bacterium]|jgi:hypothetical protein|nr:hypothetical protein [Acidobacteriota bacterium]